MIDSLPSNFIVAPHVEPKQRFLFGNVSTESSERPPQANKCKYRKKQLMEGAHNVG